MKTRSRRPAAPRTSWHVPAMVLVGAALTVFASPPAESRPSPNAPALAAPPALEVWTRSWRDDPVWYDGQAECAVYRAVRSIYGVERAYRARVFTNKENFDPRTRTKSAGRGGPSVFKHHRRETIPTESYDYQYSTMSYVGVDDLGSVKLDMGSQEDCGATFKQFDVQGGELRWRQFSYFPNEGARDGRFAFGRDGVFEDALPLVLRGYPFRDPRELTIRLVPTQTSTKWSPVEPIEATVRFIGEERLDLPVGSVTSYRLRVQARARPSWQLDLWFAAEAGATASNDPGLHVMVKSVDSRGPRMELESVERRAYWAR